VHPHVLAHDPQEAAEGSQDAEDLDLVIAETKRCATIIRRLLDFARQRPPEKKFADLNEVIADTVRLVERPPTCTTSRSRSTWTPACPASGSTRISSSRW